MFKYSGFLHILLTSHRVYFKIPFKFQTSYPNLITYQTLLEISHQSEIPKVFNLI